MESEFIGGNDMSFDDFLDSLTAPKETPKNSQSLKRKQESTDQLDSLTEERGSKDVIETKGIIILIVF